jgi:ankyrin repeat protein
MFTFLLQKGADINQKGRYGQTPLHYASIRGNLSAIRILQKNGVHWNVVNDNDESELHLGQTYTFCPFPLQLWGNLLSFSGVKSRSAKVVRHLLAVGSNPSSVNMLVKRMCKIVTKVI